MLKEFVEEVAKIQLYETCDVCNGQVWMRNPSWREFSEKYGDDDKHPAIEILLNNENEKNGSDLSDQDAIEFCMKQGLSEEEAKDFLLLYFNQVDQVECENCNEGLKLTEDGMLLKKLADILKMV